VDHPAGRDGASPRRGGLAPVTGFMSEQPPRPDSPDAAGLPPPAPPVSDALAEADCDILLAGQVPPSDDTPTIISKSPPKTQANLFSGILRGRKLKGMFTLVKMRPRDGSQNAWLLIKDHDDACVKGWDPERHAASVKTGRTLDDLAKSRHAARWISNRRAASH